MKFRKINLLAALTLFAVAGLCVPAQAAMHASASQDVPSVTNQEKPKKGNGAVGTIVALDLDNNKFTLKVNGEGDEAKEIEVTINDDTKFMIGKEASTREAVLVLEGHVRVKHQDGVAQVVTAMPKGAKPKKPDGDE